MVEWLSSVAGILDRGGGARVVVGSRRSIRSNTREGERAFIVPDLRVKEPVPQEKYAFVVTTTVRHMKSVLDGESGCGGCRACCKTMPIDEINKRSHVLCSMSNELVGCTIHHKKPHSCKVFECLWLKSQRRNDRMPPELRPDRCGVIFTDDTSQHMGGKHDSDRIEAHEDRDGGVRNHEAVQSFVDEMIKFGKRVDKITHYHGEEHGNSGTDTHQRGVAEQSV